MTPAGPCVIYENATVYEGLDLTLKQTVLGVIVSTKLLPRCPVDISSPTTYSTLTKSRPISVQHC